jgi:CHAT domain-containing protein
MKNFYTNRGEQRKMSKAQALQEAQQQMIESKGKNNDWSHPYYWAGFVLMGNWL